MALDFLCKDLTASFLSSSSFFFPSSGCRFVAGRRGMTIL
jgi:hypothetical protein